MKILVKAIAGSHLFGTNTISSDQDFKGIFLPSADDILLGKFDQTVNQSTNKAIGQKNDKDDIDLELYSLDKFLKMLYQGQTVALELLFTPEEFILEQHPYWRIISNNAHHFISSKCTAFIGYTKTQAARYGIRGSRMETLEKVILILRQYEKHQLALKDISQFDKDSFAELEHVELMKDKNGKELLVVCGKKFGWDTKISFVLKPLEKYYTEYGERSRLAKLNQGVDYKALSHAIRVSMQAQSLLTTGKILLPMAPENVTLLKDVKAGKYDYLTVAQLIEDNLDKVLELQKTSTLPSEPNLEAFQEIQKHFYRMIIKGEI